jgi:peptide/nickel transport system substrate-binding protein
MASGLSTVGRSWRCTRRLLLLSLGVFTTTAGLTVAHAEDLHIGLAAPATSMDPHFYNASPNISVAIHVFDRLTHRSPDAKVIPWLAESWRPVDDTTWEFKLRPGVTFHDGSPLTPDDIAFTIARAPNVPNSPGGFGGYLRAIKSVETVDPTTIRFHTGAPAPNLPGDVSTIAIVSRHVGEHATTEDYNSGRAAIGTGPYRLVRYISGDRVELTRNDAWWGKAPEWEHVTIRFIPNPGSRVAALLAGDVDLIDVPPASDLPRLKADPKLSVFSVQGLRVIYVYPDFSRDGEEPFVSGPNGEKLDKNPLQDVRVRQALSIAINRTGIVDRVMQGTAVATGQWLPPGTFGYASEVKVPPYDPERAKAMLAEAGFPHGFRLTLHTPNDRYPNDAATAQAVAQMWTRVGVQTAVDALPWSAFSVRSAHQDFSMGLIGWGSNTAEAGYTLVNIIGTYDAKASRGASNNGRYSNPALDALTDRALATLDDTAREKLLVEGVTTSMQQLPFIPLHQLINFWATRKGITYDPRQDERTVALNAHHVE